MRRAMRSSKLRKVNTRSPSGKKVLRASRRRGSGQICADCGALLNAPKATKNRAKSTKKPNRPYSNLCSGCMRKRILEG